ncbi:hypothetical protein FS749_013893 [Ceratobasidium sp. UAMH 11750]|nr:hypothetical protein FS749_013893 [Ceratobasidium sp. UAMH 11750]
MSALSHPELFSFNPLASHPFTAGGSVDCTPIIQTSTPPEDSLLFSSVPRSASSSPEVSPLEVLDQPIFAPKPIPSYVPRGVFEQYDRGRVTPDLVIRKKLNNWSIQRSH